MLLLRVRWVHFKISAEYSEKKEAGFDLIDRDLTVELSADKYRFIDNLSGTVLTERTFETEGKIEFQGLVLEFSENRKRVICSASRLKTPDREILPQLVQLSNLEKAEIFENSKVFRMAIYRFSAKWGLFRVKRM